MAATRFAVRSLYIVLWTGAAYAAPGDGAPAGDGDTAELAGEVIGEVIEIAGGAREPAQTHLTAAEAREMPGSLGDPVRAVMALPGVAPTTVSHPDFYLR